MISNLNIALLVGSTSGFRVPLSLKKNQHRRVEAAEFSSTMTNYNDNQYYATLYFGSAAQTIEILLDSGSSSCWVPVAGCPITECPGEKFDTSSSSSFVDGTTGATIS